uniref:Odorant binding protein 6 n=1 Tax=Culex pipiens pallens TaxID=42434 RepID=A0A142CQX7_CULPA|nr:odorant binding protein 6 [Culex pipiens pallens]
MERFTFVILVLFLKLLGPSDGAMTMKQLKNSLEMMRKACAPKFKVDDASLNELTAGNFRSDPDPELKCYTVCIAQMAGTLTKKGEISLSKTTAQIDAMLPNEMKAFAKEAMTACKDAQAGYKETCDKIYYSVKCVAEFNKDALLFP